MLPHKPTKGGQEHVRLEELDPQLTYFIPEFAQLKLGGLYCSITPVLDGGRSQLPGGQQQATQLVEPLAAPHPSKPLPQLSSQHQAQAPAHEETQQLPELTRPATTQVVPCSTQIMCPGATQALPLQTQPQTPLPTQLHHP